MATNSVDQELIFERISHFISRIRRERGLSQFSLAKITGVSQSVISDLESKSRKTITFEVFFKLARLEKNIKNLTQFMDYLENNKDLDANRCKSNESIETIKNFFLNVKKLPRNRLAQNLNMHGGNEEKVVKIVNSILELTTREIELAHRLIETINTHYKGDKQ